MAPASDAAETTGSGPPSTGPDAQLRRIFVGAKISLVIATQLVRVAEVLGKVAARAVAPDNVHLTLVPPWNEERITDAIAKLAGVAGKFAAFPLYFRHVGYGPQPRRPRLLWAECAATPEIVALRAALLEVYDKVDERPFLPHVTLARIYAGRLTIARRHPIDQPLSLMQRVETIELFQPPPRGEATYRVLASLPLAGTATPAPVQ